MRPFLYGINVLSKELIDKNGNTLMHVDSHSDFGYPVADQDINKLSVDLAEIENYTYW